MKGKLINWKGNKDGSIALYFEKGLDKKALVDLEGKEIEVTEAGATVEPDRALAYQIAIDLLRKAFNAGNEREPEKEEMSTEDFLKGEG
jgi:hypothetical protein